MACSYCNTKQQGRSVVHSPKRKARDTRLYRTYLLGESLNLNLCFFLLLRLLRLAPFWLVVRISLDGTVAGGNEQLLWSARKKIRANTTLFPLQSFSSLSTPVPPSRVRGPNLPHQMLLCIPRDEVAYTTCTPVSYHKNGGGFQRRVFAPSHGNNVHFD